MTLTTRKAPAGSTRDADSASTAELSQPPRVVRADVDRLHRSYSAILALVVDPPRSGAGPELFVVPARTPAATLLAPTLVEHRSGTSGGVIPCAHTPRPSNTSQYGRALATSAATSQGCRSRGCIGRRRRPAAARPALRPQRAALRGRAWPSSGAVTIGSYSRRRLRTAASSARCYASSRRAMDSVP
jgi:hypothetical protein